jgi:hypothetical protein
MKQVWTNSIPCETWFHLSNASSFLLCSDWYHEWVQGVITDKTKAHF